MSQLTPEQFDHVRLTKRTELVVEVDTLSLLKAAGVDPKKYGVYSASVEQGVIPRTRVRQGMASTLVLVLNELRSLDE